MSLFKSKCSKSKLLNTKKIAEHSKVFCFKFTDSSRQEHDAVTVSAIWDYLGLSGTISDYVAEDSCV